MHRSRHDTEPGAGTGVGGPAGLLGERPDDPDAAFSWDYAAAKIDELDTSAGPEIDSGPGL